MNLLLKKLYLEKKEFVTSPLLKQYCKTLKLDYDSTIKYLLSAGYLIRIFRGIFYVKTLEETKLNQSKYNPWELVAKGLELKKVTEWYFGLNTALKLNNITHEYFTVEYVINDKIFRAKPIAIAGYKFKFIKFKPNLIKFGIKKKGILRYSDYEKTILDSIYLKKYKGVPDKKIILGLLKWPKKFSKNKIKSYLKYYPKTISKIIDNIR